MADGVRKLWLQLLVWSVGSLLAQGRGTQMSTMPRAVGAERVFLLWGLLYFIFIYLTLSVFNFSSYTNYKTHNCSNERQKNKITGGGRKKKLFCETRYTISHNMQEGNTNIIFKQQCAIQKL